MFRPTKDSVESLLPEGFSVNMHLESGTKTNDNYEKIVTASKGDVHLTFNETTSMIFATGYSVDPNAIDVVRSTVDDIFARSNPIPDPPDDRADTNFWRLTQQGPAVASRSLTVPTWDEISHNYAISARTELERLNALTGIDDPQAGNIVILHGPAGTGKTTALRALARSWKPWADIHYIVDPDQFLGQADYMWQAVLSMGEADLLARRRIGSSFKPRYKMIIMEDTDELIRSDAKEQVGQAFSRLLNLGDGFLGQSQRLIIVLTTNAPIGTLAPAITRPGRCLANIEVPRFNPSEAQTWLDRYSDPVKEYTLAEMFQLLASDDQIVAKSDVAVPGQYL